MSAPTSFMGWLLFVTEEMQSHKSEMIRVSGFRIMVGKLGFSGMLIKTEWAQHLSPLWSLICVA
jgi:hypothetical protein